MFRKFISQIEFDKEYYKKPKNSWNFFILMYPHIILKKNDEYEKIIKTAYSFFEDENNEREALIHLPLYIIRKNIYIVEDKINEKTLINEFSKLNKKNPSEMAVNEIKRKEELRTILFAEALGNKGSSNILN